MANVVTVRVAKRKGSFFARPASARLHPGDTFELLNRTAEPMIFRVKGRLPFGRRPQLVEIRERTGVLRRTVRGLRKKGHWEYSYQVLMVKSGRKAKGNSDPEIIIDNP